MDQQTAYAPYEGQEPYVFISYCHKDNDLVRPIIHKMMDDGYRVWYDAGIQPGVFWDDYIAERIEGCQYFLAMITANSLESENCLDELHYAREERKSRLLVYLEDAPLTKGLRLRLGRLQDVRKYTIAEESKFYQKLYSAKGIDVCHNSTPTAVLAETATRTQIRRAIETPTAVLAEPAPYTISLPSQEKWLGWADQEVRSYVESEYALGMQSMYNGDYSGAIRHLEAAATWGRGFAPAQFSLGNLYFSGKGGQKDTEEAIRYYRLAAKQGHSEAKRMLKSLGLSA